MKNLKRGLAVVLTVVMLVPMFTAWSVVASGTISPSWSGETSRTSKLLYNGVTSTNIKTSSSSKYDLQSFNIVEFDLAQTDLYVDVTNERDYVNQSKTTLNTVTSFNANNGEGKTAIAAINGDLWTMSSAHSRVEGAGTSYGGYNDAVVTKALTLPRGFTIYDGEIVCSSQIEEETPYEGDFWSFGVSDGYVPMIGCPELEITVKNNSINKTVAADGLNRLPANNALVVYSDKGCLNNYALSDAHEVVIDVNYDYTVEHGASITGTVTGIYSSAAPTSNPTMQDNRIILTARGSALSKLSGFAVGNSVTLNFSVTERYGRNTEGWQTATCAVGGHMPFVVDGVKWETGTTTNYPTTIVGIKNDGNVVFIVNDGRQSSFSTGLDFNDYWDFADDMDLNTAFILDGGGSANLVELSGTSYNVVNSPSDGSARSVINSVILSAGPKRVAQDSFNVKVPSDNIDLTNLNFADDDAYMLLTNFGETKLEKTADGVKMKVADFLNGPTVSISYGLPGTSSTNANSVLAGRSYDSISASSYPYLVLDMSLVTANSSVVQFQALYHTAGSRKGVSTTTFIGFNNAYNNNGFGKYIINPASNSAYTGKLNTFRLQYLYPANGVTVQDGDYVILRSARLATSATEANTFAAAAAPTTQKVTFNANGGSVDQTTKYAVHGQEYGVMPVPVKDGCDFKGWYTAASGGTKVTEDTSVTTATTRTLYAQWEVSTDEPDHTPMYITFDYNGGTGYNGVYEVKAGQSYREAVGGELREPVRTGYDFAGWTIDGDVLDLDDIHSSEESVVFVAQWTQKLGKYKVTIDGLGHRTGPASSYSYTAKASLSLNTVIDVTEVSNGWGKCTVEGTEGWSSMKYLTYVEELLPGAYFQEYARFTVDFNGAWYNTAANATSGSLNTSGVGIDNQLSSGLTGIEIHVFNRINQSTSSNINDGNYFGVVYANGTQVGGFPNLGDLMNVVCRSLVRDSHDFVKISNPFWGEFTLSDLQGGKAIDTTLLDGGNYKFTIEWEPQTNTLTFDPDGGEMPDGYELQYTFVGDQRFDHVIGDLPVATRAGYEFKGWKRDADLWSGSWGTQPYTFGKDVTLIAVWEEKVEEPVVESSVVEEDGSYYLEIDGVRQEKGLYQVGNDYYYVKYDGTLARGEIVFTYYHRDVLPAAYREFGEDCKLINGWLIKDENRVYYSVNGEHLKGIAKIGNDYYFFNAQGEMCTNGRYFVPENEYGLQTGAYYFGADGKLSLTGEEQPTAAAAADVAMVAQNSGLGNYIESTETLAVNTASVVLPEAEGSSDNDEE